MAAATPVEGRAALGEPVPRAAVGGGAETARGRRRAGERGGAVRVTVGKIVRVGGLVAETTTDGPGTTGGRTGEEDEAVPGTAGQIATTGEWDTAVQVTAGKNATTGARTGDPGAVVPVTAGEIAMIGGRVAVKTVTGAAAVGDDPSRGPPATDRTESSGGRAAATTIGAAVVGDDLGRRPAPMAALAGGSPDVIAPPRRPGPASGAVWPAVAPAG